MIVYKNKVEEVPQGRYSQKLGTSFLTNSIPSWLNAGANVSYVNNGIKVSDRTLETCYFDVDGMNQVSCEFFNIRFSSDSAVASIKLVNEDGHRWIGIYSNGTKTFFSYCNASGVETQIEEVGYMGDILKFRFMGFGRMYGSYGNRPKNLRLSLSPYINYANILENGVPSYTCRNLDSYSVDWSGKWKFVVEDTGDFYCSGVELMIQQNI